MTPHIPTWTGGDRTRLIRLVLRITAILLCGIHAYNSRHTMNPDGISYLDVADAYGRGDLSNALNAYWSPLYSWLLMAVLSVVGPSPYWESAVVHLVNLGIFFLALLAFEWLLNEILVTRSSETEESDQHRLPDWVVVGFAYALFAVVSRRLVTVSLVTPDMLVAAVVYAVSALILRTRRLGDSPGRSLCLGGLLGLGYLSKAVLFPLAFVFLFASVGWNGWRRGVRHVALAGLAFAILAAPFVVALSWAANRPTFGDSGRLNYAWYVNSVPSPHLLGASGQVPTTHQSPVVSVFSRPGGGSYPLWYAPHHWYTGPFPGFDLLAQMRAMTVVAQTYADLLLYQLGTFSGILIVGFVVACVTRRTSLVQWLVHSSVHLKNQFALLVPALAALGLYLLVGHSEGRLVGPFVVLAALALLGALRIDQQVIQKHWAPQVGLLLCLTLPLVANLGYDLIHLSRAIQQGESAAVHPDAAVASRLTALGLEPGNAVGSIGFTYSAYWARLGGWQVVAEIPQRERSTFFKATPTTQAKVFDAFRQAGAQAIVCSGAEIEGLGWQTVPGTGFAIYDLRSTRDQPDNIRLAATSR